jgi:hypothetical protein
MEDTMSSVRLSEFSDKSNLTALGTQALQARKEILVDLGMYALSHGQWQMVEALTLLVQRGGYAHV